jgi:RAB protein geranylgeranyltransferase component A
MELLSDTKWDVVICGTGIRQSLLALYACPQNQLMDPNLTDLADSTVLYPAQGRRFSTLTKTNIMEAQRQPSVCKMLQHG